uniref:Uncharacterized protein n=1 Tax=Acrobeloides nanus TaxID=290746 RepID=A0A914DAD0_9BILA
KQVQTAHGNISITIYGDRHKIPILTLHDVGSNAEETFARFFQSPIGDEIGTEFCIYNINAPGQQKNVKEFPFWYHYPTMDNFVHIIEEIVDFFKSVCF